MKKILGLVIAAAVMALGTNAHAASFTAGNIVIYRVGDGSQILTNAGNTVFLDEYSITNNGTASAPSWSIALVQSIQMPTNWYGANAPLIGEGAANSMGPLSLSTDGRFIVLTGFGATLGQYTNDSLGAQYSTNAVPRVVGLVDGFGNIYTTTAQTNANELTDEPRSAVSTDGTNIWLCGSTTGAKYTTRGSLNSTQVCEAATVQRVLNIYNQTLYFDAVNRVGGATNTAALLPTNFVAANFANLPGVYTNATGGSPYGYALFSLKGGAAPDTLYICDNLTNTPFFGEAHGGAILKYAYLPASNVWVSCGSITAAGATFLTGKLAPVGSQTNVTLFITQGGTMSGSTFNSLFPYIDTSGYNGDPGANDDGGDANQYKITLNPNGGDANENTRGIAFVPQGGDSFLKGPGAISVGPPYPVVQVGNGGGPFSPASYAYSVANLGTNTLTTVSLNTGPANWLTASPSGFQTLAPGTSITFTVVNNSNAANLTAGLHTGFIVFNPGSIQRPVSILVNAFDLTPDSNFVAVGEPGGPFTPASQVYVLTNVTTGPLSWSAGISATWDSLSVTGGTLPGQTGTNITISINHTANSLGIGVYADTLVFTNTTANSPLPSHTVTLQVGSGFFDDFSAYTQNTDLVPQNNWNVLSSANDAPYYQVTNSTLVVPYNCPGISSQEPWKNFSATDITDATAYVYAGMLVTVTGAYPTSQPDYSFAIYNHVNQQGFADDRVGLTDVGSGHYVWDCHISGIDSWVDGSTPRNYNQQYMVIIVGDVANSNTWVYVDPNLGDLSISTVAGLTNNLVPDVHDPPGALPVGGQGADPTAGSFLIGNYCNGVPQSGLTISKLAISTNYVAVYDFLTGAGGTPPPEASFTASPTNGAAPLSVIFADTSTGSVTGWAWAFGDGTLSTNQNPVNTYANPGSYLAQLIASSTGGSGTNAQTITVYDPYTWWRLFYFGSANSANGTPSLDLYGTGISNSNKFLTGFNPTNHAAYPHILSVARTNGADVNVIYLGASGDSTWSPGTRSRTNILEVAVGAAGGNYSNNFASAGATNILSGGTGFGTVTNMVDVGGATNKPSRFYRIRVLAP